MKQEINIFNHAPKELTTDAFLTWILYYLDSSDKFREEKLKFFDSIILKPEDKGKEIYDVSVSRQENNVDVLLHFKTKDDDRKFSVLFEDKTRSTYHSKKGVNQLDKYKMKYPNCYRYLYYKLAYMDNDEKQVVNEKGYEILTSEEMVKTLSEIKYIHPLVEMYYEYLEENFVAFNSSLDDNLFRDGNFDVLKNSEAQKFLCDHIIRKMDDNGIAYYGVKYDSNRDGSPFSEIKITDGKNIYGERLFWRIDYRSQGYHIRLTQYSKPYEKKKEYNAILKKSIKECLDRYNVKIDDGRKQRKALKGMDVVVIPFKSNDIMKLITCLPDISSFIVRKYNELFLSDS